MKKILKLLSIVIMLTVATIYTMPTKVMAFGPSSDEIYNGIDVSGYQGNIDFGKVKKDGKTYVKINDYQKLRTLFGQLLAEIQRIKSEGDFEAARKLVEKYAVKIDPVLHAEILARYEKLHLAPYKGFVNPVYEAVTDKDGNIIDVKVSYNEGYAEQMLRYSKEFANLPYRNE